MAVIEAGAPVPATTGPTAQVVDTALFTIATTSSTAVTAGSSQTITLASGTGLSSSMWLTVGAGATLETVLAAISGTSATAFFANAHSGTYNVVANINRQIASIGSPSVRTQIAEVDSNNRLNSILSRPANSTPTGVSASASSATLVAARTSPPRLALVVFNHSATVNAYLAEGITASIASGGYTYLVPPGATLEITDGVFTGQYNYISDSADGSYLNVTERY